MSRSAVLPRLMKDTKGSDCAYPGLELLADGLFVNKAHGRWIKGGASLISGPATPYRRAISVA